MSKIPFISSRSSALVLGLLVLLTSCWLPQNGVPEEEVHQNLTIVNESASALTFIRWMDGTGVTHAFDPDQVYDAVVQKYVGGMNPGSRLTLPVEPGTSPITFFYADGDERYRTVADIIVLPGIEDTDFTLSESTEVMTNP